MLKDFIELTVLKTEQKILIDTEEIKMIKQVGNNTLIIFNIELTLKYSAEGTGSGIFVMESFDEVKKLMI